MVEDFCDRKIASLIYNQVKNCSSPQELSSFKEQLASDKNLDDMRSTKSRLPAFIKLFIKSQPSAWDILQDSIEKYENSLEELDLLKEKMNEIETLYNQSENSEFNYMDYRQAQILMTELQIDIAQLKKQYHPQTTGDYEDNKITQQCAELESKRSELQNDFQDLANANQTQSYKKDHSQDQNYKAYSNGDNNTFQFSANSSKNSSNNHQITKTSSFEIMSYK